MRTNLQHVGVPDTSVEGIREMALQLDAARRLLAAIVARTGPLTLTAFEMNPGGGLPRPVSRVYNPAAHNYAVSLVDRGAETTGG